MAPHTHHVVISSGQSDWKSKIEDEKDVPGWGRFTHALKASVGPKGEFHNPYNNIMVSTSSFRSVHGSSQEPNAAQVLLFPSFLTLNTSAEPSTMSEFVRGYLLPENERRKDISIKTEFGTGLHKEQHTINNPTILICSHNARDSRCGILGPLLRHEFERYISQKDLQVATDEFWNPTADSNDRPNASINIGLISHIGGHKFAGNVILYIPPTWKMGGEPIPLSGTSIWYGRVEPKHVQGIVEETLLKGNVIRELFRGGLGRDGQVLRL